MAAGLSLNQLSNGNPVYEKYYRQVDASNTGHVTAGDAAAFLKRSGVTDLVLGRIWDLADSEHKGSLNKQQFFVALHLVACAQNGFDVSLKSLNAAVPPPKFHDTSSPLQFVPAPVDCPWEVKPEEKLKFDAIFNSLSPVGDMLTGDKIKPVLLNSKLPVDVLGRVWELSDIDRDGMLDRDEFAVAMYLVHRALEAKPVPMSLPTGLVPPSKRKNVTPPPVIPLLPAPPSKDKGSTHSGTTTLPVKPPLPQWVVSAVDKARCDELFTQTDSDRDGLVTGAEVREIFLKTGLSSAALARIWELCDIGSVGKLTREQFALALHLINQKLSKGIDPPQTLSPDMIPPSDRPARQSSVTSLPAADFSAIKVLDSLSNELVDLQKEKNAVELETRAQEESVQQRSSEVQDLQEEVRRESEELGRMQAERQEVQEKLERLDEQKRSLEEQLALIQQQCSQETQRIQSLQEQHSQQKQRICDYEEELSRAQEELLHLREQTLHMEEKAQSARAQLCPLQGAVKRSHTQIAQEQERLAELKAEEREVTARLTWKILEEPVFVNGTPEQTSAEHLQWLQSSPSPPEKPEESKDQNVSSDEPQELRVTEQTLAFMSPAVDWPQGRMEITSSLEQEGDVEEVKTEEQPAICTSKAETVSPEKEGPLLAPSTTAAVALLQSDPFTGSDPFTVEPFSKVNMSDPFGGDPFKGTDPFGVDKFFKQSSAGDPFTTGPKESDPFTSKTSDAVTPDPFSSSRDVPDTDPFGSDVGTPADSDPFSSPGTRHDLFRGPAREGPAVANDPFAPGGSSVSSHSDSDPFAAVFGRETLVGGFADFSSLAKSSADPFDSSTNINIFDENTQSDVPPGLPPKTGSPTRSSPSGKLHRSESSESFQRRGLFKAQGSEEFSCPPPKASVSVPLAPSSPHQTPCDPTRFHSFENQYPTEEEMMEWARQESEKEERERVARLRRQEQADLELAIALSQSELS